MEVWISSGHGMSIEKALGRLMGNIGWVSQLKYRILITKSRYKTVIIETLAQAGYAFGENIHPSVYLRS